MIMLSRNCPVAFVVGAAGFLGSHVVDKLLSKGIQVVGIDDLSTGSMDHLEEAARDKNFHFLHQSITLPFNLEIPRLDYSFFIISEDISSSQFQNALESFLQIQENFSAKILLVSTIDNYDHHHSQSSLMMAEKALAKFATDKKRNARVVRLSTVFGPRMHFREDAPIIRLIKSAIFDQLQKESTPLDFSTRAIFIDDAVSLLIKAVLHGSTSQKIYDGAEVNPVKVAEVKQVLLDPLWHEARSFTPTELPPWPTPNLVKTEKELSWHPHTSIVTALKETLHYFKEKPELVTKLQDNTENHKREEREEEKIKEERSFLTQGWEKNNEPEKKQGVKTEKKDVVEKEINKEEKNVHKKGWKDVRTHVLLLVTLFLISYGLVLPIFNLTWKLLAIPNHFTESKKEASLGHFEKAVGELNKITVATATISRASVFLKTSFLVDFYPLSFVKEDQSLEVLEEMIGASQQILNGSENIYQGFKVLSGEEGSFDFFQQAEADFIQAEKRLAEVQVKLEDNKSSALELVLRTTNKELQQGILDYQKKTAVLKTLTVTIPSLVGQGNKYFLVEVLDNRKLLPGGGQVVVLAAVSFKDGKLQGIKSGGIEKMIKAEGVTYPKEMVTDYAGKISGKAINYEADFSSNAKLLQQYLNKEYQGKVSGVAGVDLNFLAGFIEVTSPVTLKDGEVIGGQQLLEDKVIENPEVMGEILEEVLNRIFFLSDQNWVKLLDVIEKGILGKHLLIYSADPKVFSYLTTQGWTGAMAAVPFEKKGEREEFLALTETDIKGINSFNLTRAMKWQTRVEEGNINHEVSMIYQGKGALNGQRRVKIYLPLGSKLKKVTFQGKNLTSEVRSFSDYNRTGFSLLLDFLDVTEGDLLIEYQDKQILDFDQQDQAKLKFKLQKQIGIGEGKFEHVIFLPNSLKLIAGGPVLTDFSQDLEWDIMIGKR